MAISIEHKVDCTGCGACVNACPQKCTFLVEDEHGFSYPTVDTSNCIGCDICTKVCPIINPGFNTTEILNVYAAWSKDEHTRFSSTSGGVFSELANAILSSAGWVVGAAYIEDNMVEHIIVKQINDIERVRQSKYVQSSIGDVYSKIRDALKQGKKILFCGTPCQVAGLKNYLKIEYEGLYTADFICRGVNSPKAYKYWLKELEEKNKSSISRVWFKYKENGWKKSPYCTRIDFESGKIFVANAENNYFMRGYLQGNLYLRPSCSQCSFKGMERISDVTLADFWKISEELDDDQGTSMVLINSNKGAQLFDEIKERINYSERTIGEISQGNLCFTNSVKLNPKGDKFLRELGNAQFSELIQKYTKISIRRKILNKIKLIGKKIKKNK